MLSKYQEIALSHSQQIRPLSYKLIVVWWCNFENITVCYRCFRPILNLILHFNTVFRRYYHIRVRDRQSCNFVNVCTIFMLLWR